MGPELIVVNGPLAGTHYAIPNGGLLIGRAPNAEIVLAEPELGWRHCQIRQQRDRYLVSDLRTSLALARGSRSNRDRQDYPYVSFR
jgi:predicted component of type VI protein secretion system